MVDTRELAISNCQKCHRVCHEMLVYHGDVLGGKQLSPQHIKRLMAAIEISQLTADMLAIRAPLVDRLCELCAEVCEQCATSCIALDHEAMQRCAEVCIHAAKACYDENNHIKQAA